MSEVVVALYRNGMVADAEVATTGLSALLVGMMILAKQSALEPGDSLIVSDDARLIGSVLRN
jgi:hypothetical protein